MTNSKKTRAQLIAEIEAIRQRLATLEALPANKRLIKLEGSLRFYREMINNLSESVFVVRLADGIIVYSNPQNLRVFGYTQDELVGQHVSIVNAPTDQSPEETANEIMTSIKENGNWTGKIYNIKKDGTKFWNRAHISAYEHSEYGSVFISIHIDISEHKQAEEALKASEEKYRRLFESAVDMIHIVDDQYRIIDVNETELRKLGYSRSELIGKTLAEIIHPEYRQITTGLITTVRSGKTIESYETALQSKEGEKILVAANVVPLMVDGRFAGAQATIHDITERKRAEEELQSSRLLLQTVFDSIPVGVYVKDLEGRLLMVNNSQVQGVQLEGKDIIGLTTTEIGVGTAEEIKETALQDRSVLEKGKRIEVKETSLTLANGEKRLWHVIKAPLHDATGNIIGLVGTRMDITERKRAESALIESEAKYQQLYDSAPDMFASIDAATGNMLKCNQTFVRNIGYPIEQILGQHISKFYHPDSEEDRKIVFKQFITEGKVQNAELQLQRSDGTTIDVSLNISALRDENGKIIHSVSIWRDITERNTAEEALRESEKRIRQFIDSAPALLGYIDKDYHYQQVNLPYKELLGKSDKEILGKTVTEVLGQEACELLSPYIEEALVGREVSFDITRTIRESQFELHASYVPDLDKSGRVLGYYFSVLDITDRKRAETAMQESEKRLKAIMDNMPALVTLRDMEGRFLLVNSEYEKRLGVSAVDIIGKMPHKVLDKASADEVEFRVRTVIDTGEARTHEEEIRDTDQAAIILMTRFPVYDGKNNMVAVGGIGIDVTAQKKVEQALRESEERYRDLVNGSLQGILVHRGHKPLFVNDTFAKVYGYDSHTDIMTMNNVLNFLVAPQDRERIKLIGKSRLKGEDPTAHYEVQGIKKDGTIFWLDSTNTVIKWEGQPAILSTQIDVSQRKSLEDQLRHAQKMEAIGTLAGGIAHDFNNILAPIIGFTHLLLKKANPQSLEHEDLTIISKAAHRAADLVSQILLFSQRGQSVKTVCDIGPITREVTKLMRSTLPKSIVVSQRVSADLGLVYCDASNIFQVLLNLCINAGQAMQGSGKLSIVLGNVELDHYQCVGKSLNGYFVRMVITDNGVGMDEETMAHIFDPFYTTKESGKGTGLGLSTVYGIVTDHDGGICVSSEKGKGSTFEIYLPISEEDLESVAPSQPPTFKGIENIMFVDDEQSIVNICKRLLEEVGYKVECFTDSMIALDAFKENPDRFDLVFTDQSMPIIDGSVLAARMRESRRDIPIIICTGHSEMINPEKSKAMGINAFMYKPIDPNDLLHTVRQVLDEAR